MKKGVITNLLIIFMLLSISFVSANFTEKQNIVEENQTIEKILQKDKEPLWGVWGLWAVVNEKYGPSENPQYRPLSDVTVYFWDCWLIPIKPIIIRLIYNSHFINQNFKNTIFNNLAYKIDETTDLGWSSASGRNPIGYFLVYVEKEGYSAINKPFQTGVPGMHLGPPGEAPTIYFIMEKSEK